MGDSVYTGMLFIGDPHLCGRVPGFRRDDYPKSCLKKLRWCLEYARENQLLACLLGDLFHYPRDNANGMLVELMDLLDDSVLAIAGNHDCAFNSLEKDDTLSVLFAAGRLRQLGDTEDRMWHGMIGSHEVALGGSCWGQRLPKKVELTDHQPRWVIWLAHHDVQFPGYEEKGQHTCHEIDGVDLLVNGHIHRNLAEVVTGRTTWCNPGNIVRVNRSDATRAHQPGVLRVKIEGDGLHRERVNVPCESFETVFHEQLSTEAGMAATDSDFVKGLAALEHCKTNDGQGLEAFLDKNLGQFDEKVAGHIRKLARRVLSSGANVEDEIIEEVEL